MKIQDLTNNDLSSRKYENEKIVLGPNAEIINSFIEGYYSIDAWSSVRHSSIKKHGGIGAFTYVSGCDIGKYSSISARCCIGRSNHPSNWLSTSEFQFRNSHDSRFESLEDEDLKKWDSTKRTTIGNDVWIGDSAVILKGTKIGDGCIVGAGSIVTKDLESYSIAVGNPAKKIKYRFSQSICEKLKELRWWDNIEFKNLAGIEFDNIEKAIDQIENLIRKT